MIVDTSAIVAVMLGEDRASDIVRLLADGPARMSAATLVELHAVAAHRLSAVQQRAWRDRPCATSDGAADTRPN